MTEQERMFEEYVNFTGDSSLRMCPARTVSVEPTRVQHWKCDRWDEHDDESHVWMRTTPPKEH